VPSYFLTTKKAPQKEALLKGLVFYGVLWELVTAENLTYFIGFEVKIKTHNVSMFDVIDVVVYVV
jgi:hypothetical protein